MDEKSRFVSILAWIFIICAGFATFTSLMQTIMVSTIFTGDEFRIAPDDAPPITQFMSQNLHLFVYGFFAMNIFAFITSIALLRRKNWARLAFIFILAFGIVWQLGGIAYSFTFFEDFDSGFSDDEGYQTMVAILRWGSFFVAVAISVTFAWIIKKLLSPSIVSEFALNKPKHTDGASAAGV